MTAVTLAKVATTPAAVRTCYSCGLSQPDSCDDLQPLSSIAPIQDIFSMTLDDPSISRPMSPAGMGPWGSQTVRLLVDVARMPENDDDTRIAAIRRLATMAEDYCNCCSTSEHAGAGQGRHRRRIELFDECGAIAMWCSLCGPAHPIVVRQAAVTAIGNVATFSNGATEVLVMRGCIEALMTLLVSDVDAGTPEGEDAVYAALDALANQFGAGPSSGPLKGTLLALTARPSLERLVALSKSTAVRVAETSGWLLCLLSTNAETSHDALAHSGMLPAIICYGGRGTPQAQEEASWALASLLAEATPADEIAELDSCYDLLLELVVSGCTAARVQASWALANLSLHPVGQQRLAERSSVAPLVEAIRAREEEEELLHQAARALGSILLLPAGRKQLLALEEGSMRTGTPGALEMLLVLSSHTVPAIGDAAMRASIHASIRPCSAAAHIVALDRGMARLCEMLEPMHTLKRQRMTVSALAHLAFAARAAVLNQPEGASPSLKRFEPLQHVAPHEMDLRRLALCAAPLVAFISACECSNTLAQAAAVIANLSQCHTNGGEDDHVAVHIARAGALPVLKLLSESENPQLRLAGHAALESVSSCLTPQSRRLFRPAPGGKRERRRSILSKNAPCVTLPRTTGLDQAHDVVLNVI